MRGADLLPTETLGEPRRWVVTTLGASAGVAVVAFLVIPWPAGLVVPALLAGWALILSALAHCSARRLLVIAGASALILGGLMVALLSLLGP